MTTEPPWLPSRLTVAWRSGRQRARLAARSLLIAGFALGGITVGTAGTPAQPSGGRTVAFEVVGQLEPSEATGGHALAVAVSGTRTYLGVANRVHVLDVTTPWDPTQLGITPAFSDTVRALAVDGEWVYVAAGAAGVYIVDASAPQQPTVTGVLPMPGEALDLAVSGHAAYVAAGAAGLRVLDVSDPFAPREVAALDGLGMTHALSTVDGRVYLTATDGAAFKVHVVDVGDPAAPRLVGGAALAGVPLAVLATNDAIYTGDDSGVITVFQTESPDGLTAVGRFTEVVRPRSISAVARIIVVADLLGRLSIVDIANPARPQAYDAFGTAGRPQDVAIAANHAFVANGADGLWVVPLTSTGRYGSYRTLTEPGALDGLGVAVDGGYTYYGNRGSGLLAVDVRDAGRPQTTRILSVEGWITDVAAGSGMLVATAQDDGLSAFDIARDPAVPRLIGTDTDPHQASGVTLVGGRAYVGAGPDGLWAYDVSGQELRSRWSLALPGWCAGVAANGEYAYVAGGTAGVHVVGLVGGRPQLAATVDTPGMAMDVALSEDSRVAVVADGARGLRVLDLSYPAHPRDVGFYPVPGDAWDVMLHDGLAFVAANKGGLFVVDVSDPALPTLAGRLSIGTPIRGVAVSAPFAYVAGAGSGLSVVRFSVGARPVPTAYPSATAEPSPPETPASGTLTPGVTGTPGAIATATATQTAQSSSSGTPSVTGTSIRMPTPTGSAAASPSKYTCYLPLNA